MPALVTGLSYVCDSLAGYLLITAITSGFSLVSKFKLPRITLKLHSTLPELQDFNPIECLVLYLIAYPALAMYRAIPSDHVVGYLALAVGLLSLLLWGIGPAMTKIKQEDEPKDEIVSLIDEMRFNRETTHTHFRAGSNISCNLTVDTNSDSVIDLQEDNVVTLSADNKGKMSEQDDMDHFQKDENKDEISCYGNNNLCSIPLSEEALANFDKDLCHNCKIKLESGGFSISIVPSSVQRSSVKITEDEDALSVVTWNQKTDVLKPSTSSEDLSYHRRGSSNQDKVTPRISHRKTKSQLPVVPVNLIDDSNQEPHYSNLIDSANAPIFGVDSEGRVNVWNKCAMRIVGYTAEEVMGKNLVKEFITKDYQASVGTVIDRALLGDETANYEFPLMTKDGVRIEILLNATARRNPNGEIIGVVGEGSTVLPFYGMLIRSLLFQRITNLHDLSTLLFSGIGQDITGRIAQEREYTRLIDTANAPIFGVDTQCGKFEEVTV